VHILLLARVEVLLLLAGPAGLGQHISQLRPAGTIISSNTIRGVSSVLAQAAKGWLSSPWALPGNCMHPAYAWRAAAGV
jgi:hypothetical protein